MFSQVVSRRALAGRHDRERVASIENARAVLARASGALGSVRPSPVVALTLYGVEEVVGATHRVRGDVARVLTPRRVAEAEAFPLATAAEVVGAVGVAVVTCRVFRQGVVDALARIAAALAERRTLLEELALRLTALDLRALVVAVARRGHAPAQAVEGVTRVPADLVDRALLVGLAAAQGADAVAVVAVDGAVAVVVDVVVARALGPHLHGDGHAVGRRVPEAHGDQEQQADETETEESRVHGSPPYACRDRNQWA